MGMIIFLNTQYQHRAGMKVSEKYHHWTHDRYLPIYLPTKNPKMGVF
jgi:hypothetical protein